MLNYQLVQNILYTLGPYSILKLLNSHGSRTLLGHIEGRVRILVGCIQLRDILLCTTNDIQDLYC